MYREGALSFPTLPVQQTHEFEAIVDCVFGQTCPTSVKQLPGGGHVCPKMLSTITWWVWCTGRVGKEGGSSRYIVLYIPQSPSHLEHLRILWFWLCVELRPRYDRQYKYTNRCHLRRQIWWCGQESENLVLRPLLRLSPAIPQASSHHGSKLDGA